jgi:segregation and condensation protein A
MDTLSIGRRPIAPIHQPLPMDYQVDLATFRGPLDLLLYLVKREEVDICDIPIARITEQFLEYMRAIELLDVERAGDFLVTAATLMEIKSRMLLPRMEAAVADEDDPRQELVRQLLEYKKFKEAAALLEAQAEQQSYRLPRMAVETPTNRDLAQQPLRQVELWDLVSAFGRLMRETLALQPQQIIVDQTPVHVYMEMIQQRLTEAPRVAFSTLFSPPYQRGRIVGIFLAILELIKDQQIAAEQDGVYQEIWISLRPVGGG